MYMHTYICIYRYKYIKEGRRLAGTVLEKYLCFVGGQNQVVYKTHLRWYKPLVSPLDLTEGGCSYEIENSVKIYPIGG